MTNLAASILPSHPHYDRAREWIKSLAASDRIGLCRWTQLTFLRLMTTESILKEDVRTNTQALAIWESYHLREAVERIPQHLSRRICLAQSGFPRPGIFFATGRKISLLAGNPMGQYVIFNDYALEDLLFADDW